MRRIIRTAILVPVLTIVLVDFVVSLVIIRDRGDVGSAVIFAAPGYVILTIAFYLYIKSRPEVWEYMKTSGRIAVPSYLIFSIVPLAVLFYGYSTGILTTQTISILLIAPLIAGPLTVWLVFLSRNLD